MEGIQFNKQEVIIIGAGGLAREIISWHNTSKRQLDTSIIGFFDDDLSKLNNTKTVLPILGKVDFCQVKENQSVVFGIADVEVKRNIFEKAREKNVRISEFIHESTYIGERTNYGVGLILLPNALISCDVNIGDLALINIGTQIGHDAIIGDYVSIMANVDIGGGAVIGNNVFIGSNAVILPSVKIPDGTRIGAGSVVVKSIKHAGTYFGNPAKKIF